MEHWVSIDGFGNLFVECELARLDIPFIFVCADDNNVRYLALCYNDREYKYVLAKCYANHLVRILDSKLSIDDFLKEADKIFLLNLVDWDRATIQYKNHKDLSSEVLPKKDTFFTIKNKNIDKYKQKIKSEVITYKEKNNLYEDNQTIKRKQKYKNRISIQQNENGIAQCKNILSHIDLSQIDEIHNRVECHYQLGKGVANEKPSGTRERITSAA